MKIQLTYWGRNLFQKLPVAQQLNKTPTFNGTRRHDMSLLLVHVSQMNAVHCGPLRRRGSLDYHNIPLSSKAHAVSLYSQNRRVIVVKVVISHFFLSTNLELFFKQ
jgi:hypothetical protein